MTHIQFFINHLESNFPAKRTWRPMAIFVIWRFSGLSMRAIAKMFNIMPCAVLFDIKRMEGYEYVRDSKFNKEYSECLDLFIRCCKSLITHRIDVDNVLTTKNNLNGSNINFDINQQG